MKKAIVPILALITGLFLTGAYAEASSSVVSLMSYNIRNCRGLDNKTEPSRIAETIKKANPDVIAIQELDCKTQRNGQRDFLQELAEQTGLHPTYAKAIDYQGGAYGIGVLSKEQPQGVRRIPLPGREEKRVLLILEFKDFVQFATHLSLTPEDQSTSLQIIAREAATYDKPVIFSGDLNLHPGSPQGKELTRHFTILNSTEVPSFPANAPKELIDYICCFTHKDVTCKVESTEVITEPVASDHRAVLVKATLSHTQP